MADSIPYSDPNNIQQEHLKQAQKVSLIFQLANSLLNRQVQKTDQLIKVILPQENQEFLAEYKEQFIQLGVSQEIIDKIYYLPQDNIIEILEKITDLYNTKIQLTTDEKLLSSNGRKMLYEYLISDKIDLTQLANAETSDVKSHGLQKKLEMQFLQTGLILNIVT